MKLVICSPRRYTKNLPHPVHAAQQVHTSEMCSEIKTRDAFHSLLILMSTHNQEQESDTNVATSCHRVIFVRDDKPAL